jgi:hypothetical protein
MSAKSMHASRPLPADDSTLDRLDNQKRQDQSYRRPDCEMNPAGPRHRLVGQHKAAYHDVADDNDREVRWKIVRSVMCEILLAHRALIDGL